MDQGEGHAGKMGQHQDPGIKRFRLYASIHVVGETGPVAMAENPVKEAVERKRAEGKACKRGPRLLQSIRIFIRLRRRPRIYAGRNANVIRFGVMSPFTPVNDHAVLSRRSSRAKTEAFGARPRPAPKAMADGVRSSLLGRVDRFPRFRRDRKAELRLFPS